MQEIPPVDLLLESRTEFRCGQDGSICSAAQSIRFPVRSTRAWRWGILPLAHTRRLALFPVTLILGGRGPTVLEIVHSRLRSIAPRAVYAAPNNQVAITVTITMKQMINVVFGT